MKRSSFGIIAVVALIAVGLAFPVKSDAADDSAFPSLDQLGRNNVALIVEGFQFASGLRNNSQGRPNGNGFEVVPVGKFGSGFIASSDGSVITNYHVASKTLRIRAIFDDRSTYEIKHIRGYDSMNDLAILKISSNREFSTVQLGDSDLVKPMDHVLAVGNPRGLGINITEGSVSQVKRDDYDRVELVRHTAPMAPGNSGGSLYKGHQVIGVNASSVRDTQFNNAIPINKAKLLLAQSQNKSSALAAAFPTDPQIIERYRLRSIHAGIATVASASQNQLGIYQLRFPMHSLKDYMILVSSPGNDLAILVTDSSGNPIGFGNRQGTDFEGVMLSSLYEQNVTINVLNNKSQPVSFGIKIGQITW